MGGGLLASRGVRRSQTKFPYLFMPGFSLKGAARHSRRGKFFFPITLVGIVSVAIPLGAEVLDYPAARTRVFEQAQLTDLWESVEAEGRARIAAAAALPNPSAFVEYESWSGGRPDEDEATAGLSTRLDFLWKRGPRIRSAEALERMAAFRFEEQQRQLSSEVAGLFLTHQYAVKESAAVREALTALQETRRIGEMLVSRGAIPPSNLRRIDLEIQQLELAWVDLDSDRAGIVAQFSALIGIEGAVPSDDLELSELPFLSAQMAVSAAHARRPDLRALEAYARWRETEATRFRTEGLPEASLDLAYKRNNLDQTGAFIGVSVEIPIFGESRAQTRIALAERRHAGIEVDQARRKVAGEVGAAFHRWQRFQEIAATESVAARGESHRAYLQTANAAFEAGESSLLEHLDALQTHLEAARSQLAFAHQQNLATLQLAFLTASERPILSSTSLPQ